MWIKICANTTLEDARLAARAGSDAVGFVFAPSPRRVTVEHVREMVLRLPRALEKIGVFGEAEFEEIADAVATAGLTGVQLPATADAGLRERLRDRFRESRTALRILQTLGIPVAEDTSGRFGDTGTSLETGAQAEIDRRLRELAGDGSVDAVLVDSHAGKLSGGTGVVFDWESARSSFEAVPDQRRVVAGGLTPLNVAQAIALLRPWGVDVASGVEASPGKKDAAKVQAFVRAARGTPVV